MLLKSSLDLSSLASVRVYAEEIKTLYKTFHGVICNAGIIPGEKYLLTKEGVENTFAANHLGHHLLVNLLLPLLAYVHNKQTHTHIHIYTTFVLTLTVTYHLIIHIIALFIPIFPLLIVSPCSASGIDPKNPSRVVVLSSSIHKIAKAKLAAEMPEKKGMSTALSINNK